MKEPSGMIEGLRDGWATARYRLEEDNLGRLLAFAVLMLPLVFGGAFPDVVSQLAAPLLRHLSSATGGTA